MRSFPPGASSASFAGGRQFPLQRQKTETGEYCVLTMSLQGKVALITGAAGGIGSATAKELLQNNIEGVVLTDIDEFNGQKLLKELQNEFSSQRVIFVKVDTTNEDEYEGAFKKTIRTFGHVDIVFNNAGIDNEIDYTKTVDINLTGTLRGTILGLKYMSKERGGSGGVIINTASMAAMNTVVFPVYSATKSGVLGLSLNFGKKLYYEKTGVRVIALCPGFTETKLVLEQKLNENYKKEWDEIVTTYSLQKVESVAKTVVYAINKGESGSVWVINEGKLFKANIPDWLEYCELVQENI